MGGNTDVPASQGVGSRKGGNSHGNSSQAPVTEDCSTVGNTGCSSVSHSKACPDATADGCGCTCREPLEVVLHGMGSNSSAEGNSSRPHIPAASLDSIPARVLSSPSYCRGNTGRAIFPAPPST